MDDEPAILDQAKIFLEREEECFEITTLESASDALMILEEIDFDIIVSDFQMPDVDGLQFLKQLRYDYRSDIPFIMFTGRGREEVAIEALNHGADRYMQKGGDPKSQYGVLAQAIVQEVTHWRTQERLELTKYSIDNAELEVYWITPGGRFVYTNQMVSEKLGHDQEELCDMHIWDIDPDYKEEDRKDFWKELKDKGSMKIETIHETKDGDTIPVEVISNYVKHGGKELEFAFVKDIREKITVKRDKKKNIKEINIIQEAIKEISGMVSVDDIYEYVAEKVQHLNEDSSVFILLYDMIESTMILRSLYDLDGPITDFDDSVKEVLSTISIDKDNVNSAMDDTGKLKPVEGGLYDLFHGQVDESLCEEIEDLLDIRQIYRVGFKIGPSHHGDLVILKKNDNNVQHKEVIETIASYISVILQKKQDERSIKASEKKFRRIFESAPDPSFLVDDKGLIIDVNEKALQKLKYSKDEIVGNAFQDLPFLPLKSTKKLMKNFLKRMKGKKIPHYDVELITKDDEIMTVEINVGVFGEDGFEGEVVIARDITERKQVKEKLLDEKQKIKQLYEVTPKLDSVKDLDELYNLTIDIARGILDFDVCSVEIEEDGELIVRASTEKDLVEEEYSMSIEDGVAGRTFRTKQSELLRNVKKSKDAKPTDEKFCSALSVPMEDIGVFQALSYEHEKYDENDLEMAELFVSYVTEVINRLISEKALEESEARYRALVETAFAGIAVTDINDNFTFVNDRFAEMLGYEREGLIGKHVPELAVEGEDKKFEEETKKRIDGETSCYETRLIRSDGKIVDVMVHASPYKNKEGDFYGTMGVITDITEQKQAQEREELLHTLLRHDLKNKAQIVQGYLQLIEDTGNLDEETEGMIKKAIKGNKDSINLIKKVRLLLSAQREKMQQVEIASTMSDSIERTQGLAEDRDFNIENRFSFDGCMVQGGPLLKEVFSNIIENSIYHSEGSKIEISGEVQDEKVICTIEDDGKGIPDDFKEDIFQRGFTTDRQRGTGLGMFIVRMILESYDGKIEVKDSELGGVRFDLWLSKEGDDDL